MASQKADRIAIVTVHGTGDTATSADGPKWFQRGSPFSEGVKQRLAQEGVEADIVPHLWSGANSAWERERGADKLAKLLRKLYSEYGGIHVVGHSHGGNVANDAAVLVKWGLRKNATKERFDSLTTVGTPFFNIRTDASHLVAGVLFLIIAWGSAIMFPFLAAVTIAVNWGDIRAQPVYGATFIGIIALIGWCVLFMLSMSRQGIRRILRPKTGGRTKTSIFSIWHENDEAISFLERVEELPIEAFPRGAVFRGFRPSAVALGVLAVIVLSIANPILYLLHLPNFLAMEQLITEQTPTHNAGNAVLIMVFGVFFAPLIFTTIYLLYRYVVGSLSEFGMRGAMNGYVTGILRGIAYGRDGDQVLGNVAPRSHTHATVEHVLTGDVAHRMQQGAHDAAGKLIDKYRWALFSVGGDSSASLTSITTDAMTWDSLIHTTYFDQPEVVAVIADYIAAKAKGIEPVQTPAPVQSSAPHPAPEPTHLAPKSETHTPTAPISIAPGDHVPEPVAHPPPTPEGEAPHPA